MRTLIGLWILLVLTGCDGSNSAIGTVIEVPANPERGFHFPYYLSVPDSVDASALPWLVVETNNTGRVSDDYEVHRSSARRQADGHHLGGMIAHELGLPLLTPVFPRPETGWQTYTHALDRDCILVPDGELYRLDLQLLAMIDDARQSLDRAVNEKVVLVGFSASASFANRFSLLHPDRVAAVVAGGFNGILMIPGAEIDGYELDFPLGTHDYESIAGRDFPENQWAAIPQFLFMGAEDDNDAAQYGDAYSDAERAVVFGALGEIMQPDRWLRVQQAYQKAGATVEFRTYVGVGHGTRQEIHDEMLGFLRGALDQN